jgi:hypothetical protein
MDYFKELTDLLKTEQAEDRRLYRELTESTSIAQRREVGLAWFPIAIRDTELGRGDYLTVEVERTTNTELPHQLRFGAQAALFSNHDADNDRVEGTISFQGGNRLKITLRTDELPEWSRNGKLGIDLLFDDNSYNEMFGALRQAAALAEKAADGKLIRVLTGQQPPAFTTAADATTAHAPLSNYPSSKSPLNASQQTAVQKILSAEDVAVVHGPPGTGKTTTLVQAIRALVARDGGPILVAAPSNTAVDLLSEKLAESGLNVLRVGNPAKVSEQLQTLTLDSRMAEHPSMKEIKKLKKKASEFRDMAHKYKRSFGPAEREQRKALFNEAHAILKEVERTEQYILDDILSHAQIVSGDRRSRASPGTGLLDPDPESKKTRIGRRPFPAPANHKIGSGGQRSWRKKPGRKRSERKRPWRKRSGRNRSRTRIHPTGKAGAALSRSRRPAGRAVPDAYPDHGIFFQHFL